MHGEQMLISKEENITQILKGITLSTFHPEIGETIIVTIDPELYDIDLGSKIHDCMCNCFPQNNVIVRFTGITFESMMEDDLK